MKLKYALYALLFLAVGFAGVTAYLFYFASADAGRSWDRDESAGTESSPRGFAVRDRAQTASGTGGSVLIAYAGDIMGNMDPCG
jgi:hypothetical protein